jgi:HlyD family secretion protein
VSDRMTALLARLRAGHPDPATDADLLRAYVATRDEAAFTALVARHGPMVYGACRRAAGPVGDPDDAFQATFLVLARRAGSVRRPDALAAWLYRIALRAAGKARVVAARRGRLSASPAAAHADPLADLSARELLSALDAELAKLPEKYQLPLALC